MKNNKKILSIMLATNMLFTCGCSEMKDNKNTKNENNLVVEEDLYDRHNHYYIYYGSKTIIIRDCEDYLIKVLFGEGSNGYDNSIYVYDLDGNCILSNEHADRIKIRNYKEEEYANRLETILIESGDGILFDPVEFGIEKQDSLILIK